MCQRWAPLDFVTTRLPQILKSARALFIFKLKIVPSHSLCDFTLHIAELHIYSLIVAMELRRALACRDCQVWLKTVERARPRPLSQWLQPMTRQHHGAVPPSFRRQFIQQRHNASLSASQLKQKPQSPVSPSSSSLDLQQMHMRANELSASALRPEDGKLPSEQRVLYVLEQLEALVQRIENDKGGDTARPRAQPSSQSATSALLGSVNTRQTTALISKALVMNTISSSAEQILRDPNIYITTNILNAYVNLQCLLQKPSSFPDIFALYAQKSAPKQARDGAVSYHAASPFAMKNPGAAVPPGTAATALKSAIAAHDLALAIDIVETTYATVAYRNSKIVRDAGLPLATAGTLPFVLWAVCNQIGALSPALSQVSAANMAFAGFMTYLGTVGTLGYITVTTSNDQMERVTWAQGIPLWERWTREDERAAIDKIALAWGFKDASRRGEEDGEEWDFLREWVGMRSMILDKVSLMEGME
jgi:hypothetical protein